MESPALPVPVAIRFLTGPLSGQTFLIEKPIVTIGRDLMNDIAVKTDLQVSRQHARLEWTGSEWRIENVSRSNTLAVNDSAIQQAILTHGAVVQLGSVTSFTLMSEPVADAQVAGKPSASDTG